MKNGKIKRPAGVPARDWEGLLLDLEEYRDREIDGIYTEANEMSQNITENASGCSCRRPAPDVRLPYPRRSQPKADSIHSKVRRMTRAPSPVSPEPTST
jgi:hypothetical protein